MAAFERDPMYMLLNKRRRDLRLKLDRTSKRLGVVRDQLRLEIGEIEKRLAHLRAQPDSFFTAEDYGTF